MVLQDRAHGFEVRRDRDDDAVLLGQARRALRHVQPRSMEEHRRAADHLHVAKAEPSKEVCGELPANADGGPAIQDGGHEIAHDAGHRLDPCRVPVDRPVGSDAEDRNGNREPPEELRQLDQLRLVARPEGVGERDDVRVVALVDLPGGRGLDTQAVRFQLHTGGAENLLDRRDRRRRPRRPL